jgi:hypothetical protein
VRETVVFLVAAKTGFWAALGAIAVTVGGVVAWVLKTAADGISLIEKFRARRNRPRLTLIDDGSRPTTTMWWNDEFPEVPLGFVRLQVVNAGAYTAKAVSVAVYRLYVHRDGAPVELPEHVQLRGRPLGWSGSGVHDPNAESAPRDVDGHRELPVDLVHVNALFPTFLHLDTRPRLHGDPQWTDESTLTVDLDLSADDKRVPTVRYRVTVTVGEAWRDTHAAPAFRVEGPTPVPADTTTEPAAVG